MPTLTRDEALARLSELSAELAQTHRELCDLLVAEHQAKTQAWFESQSQYIKERDRIAEFNALPLSLDVIKLKGEIAALEAERVFLIECLHWGPR